MQSSGADSRGGTDSFPEVELVTFERRFWKEGIVRNKSQKSKRCLQLWDQQKCMFSLPKTCAVRRDVRRCKRREDDRASPGHCSPRNNSPLTDHILTHTHTHTHHTGVGPCHHERTTTFSYSSHLPEVFNIFSQCTKKARSQARQSPMETFLKKSVTALSFSHFSFICLPPG